MGSRLTQKSTEVRKRIESHRFDGEHGEEYEGSEFGGFGDYFRRKKIKLQNLDAELRRSSDKPQIFKGVVIHINGYTQPSLNDLHKLIVTHGGGFLQYLDGKTMATHIVASNLTPKKAIEFKKYRIVKPAWIVDSIDAGKLLPWSSYRVIDEGPQQKVLGFEGGRVVNQTSVHKKSYKEQSDASWYTGQLENTTMNRTSSQKRFLADTSPFSNTGDIFDFSEVEPRESANRSVTVPTSPPESRKLIKTPTTTGKEKFDELPSNKQRQDSISNDSDEFYDFSFQGTAEHAQKPDQIRRSGLPESEEPSVQSPLQSKSPEKLSLDEVEDPKTPSKKRKLTAEEHNAILLADPNVRKSTVVNPGFLEQFYRESRLHHLSTWKADLKSEFQAMADEKSNSQKSRQRRPPGSRRYVLHVDFDCFFAAVSLKKHLELIDSPVVVAHGNGSGSEIASCNYVARKFGVKNGMWMKRAQELCPDIKILPYDFPAYEDTSRAFYKSIIATNGTVQSVSVDEALVDISLLCFDAAGSDGITRGEGSVEREHAAASDLAQKLRDDIKSKTGCHVSVGIGGNILLAKLALRKAKPAGQYHVRSDEVLDFIGPLEVQDLPGVAWSTGGKLEEIGIKIIKDVREVSKDRLMNALGPKTGEKLWEYARGIDRKEVGEVELRKSVSAEINWGVRFSNRQQVDEFIENLCEELQKRLFKERVKGKQLTLKIMRRAADAPLDPPKHLGHGKCDSFSKAIQLGVATNSKDVLARETLSILRSFGIPPGDLRGIGVQVTKLEYVKPGVRTQGDGSQKLLQFKPGNSKPRPKASDIPDDPIEDAVTPKKQPVTPGRVSFGPEHLNQSTPSRKPLNLTGTQFILPTQVDPKVLSELPNDIRSKLIAAGAKKGIRLPPSSKGPSKQENIKREDEFPSVITALPNQSQIDPEIFNALPPDMQEEVRSFYNLTPGAIKSIEPPEPVPSPPSKEAVSGPSKPPHRPAPRRRGRPPKVRDGASTLAQSNFITSHFRRETPETGSDRDTTANATTKKKTGPKSGPTMTIQNEIPKVHPDLVGIDPEFLAALPSTMKKDVILGNRLERLRQRNKDAEHERKIAEKSRVRPPKQYLQLPPKPLRPSFTSQKLSTLPKLRNSISDWAKEFREDGPYREDAEALGTYLSRVVSEEKDMNKAVACVKWLKWVVEEELDAEKDALELWRDTVDAVGVRVQHAIKERGLGRVPM